MNPDNPVFLRVCGDGCCCVVRDVESHSLRPVANLVARGLGAVAVGVCVITLALVSGIGSATAASGDTYSCSSGQNIQELGVYTTGVTVQMPAPVWTGDPVEVTEVAFYVYPVGRDLSVDACAGVANDGSTGYTTYAGDGFSGSMGGGAVPHPVPAGSWRLARAIYCDTPTCVGIDPATWYPNASDLEAAFAAGQGSPSESGAWSGEAVQAVSLSASLLVFLAAAGFTRSFARGPRA